MHALKTIGLVGVGLFYLSAEATGAVGAPRDDIGRFVSTVLGNIEVEWTDIFREAGGTYRKPVLVLYQGQTGAACGGAAQSAMGPFYCPNDEKIYLDTSFLAYPVFTHTPNM
jgi:predicted metalloprotease